jgi:quercetin dioxygenase-like cupin family protein
MKTKRLDEVPRETVQMAGARGAVKQLVLGQVDGVPNFSMRVFTLEPGGFTPCHSHASEHLNYVISGQGELRDDDGKVHRLSSGDFAFVAPHETHQFCNAGDDAFVFICVVPKQYE